tara:strand:+ start:1289 stop:1849 length:561 start_codon:yes stop_codon:yes gene_type:complete
MMIKNNNTTKGERMEPITSESADYAEYFENLSGDAVIPVGSTVVLIDGKVRAAKDGESPFGVVRHPSAPAILCNNKNQEWSGKFLRDEFDTIIIKDDTNVGPRQAVNPSWDDSISANPPLDEKGVANESKRYLPRKDRPEEWTPVGLLGQVAISKGQPVASSWIKMWEISGTTEMYYIFPCAQIIV